MSIFQNKVARWCVELFGMLVAKDRRIRNFRFLEEAIELVQALGCTKAEALQLVDYVYNRPDGEPEQEVGGVMVTLAALCAANDIDMEECAWREQARCEQPAVKEKIRAKQASKMGTGPLPGVAV